MIKSVGFEVSFCLIKIRGNVQMTNTGQNTGTLNTLHQEQKNAMAIALVLECQNLNSGNRLMNGRNSSSCFVGSVGCEASPSSIPSSWVRDGSNLGWRKARKRLSR